jgi:putative redox protein
MTQEIKCNWKDEMAFDVEVSGHVITIDADAQFGGKDRGPRPKPLLLVSLAGCTAMDVVSLLKKMRVNFEDLTVNVGGELTDEHPKYYKKIHVTYIVKGQDIDKAKVEKAVILSQDRYCGVSAMLRQVSDLTHEIQYV